MEQKVGNNKTFFVFKFKFRRLLNQIKPKPIIFSFFKASVLTLFLIVVPNTKNHRIFFRSVNNSFESLTFSVIPSLTTIAMQDVP